MASVAPVWKQYRGSARIYNLTLLVLNLGLIAAAFHDPAAALGVFVFMLHVLFLLHALVRRHRCPACDQPLISGPRAPSDLAAAFGVFPRECSHCGAGPDDPQCACEGCRAASRP